MSRRLDEDDEATLPQRESRASSEREMTLGTGAILGIFLGLVLLCGAFFGFGYKLGSSSAEASLAGASADASEAQASPSTNFGAFKPSAGSPAASANGGIAPSGVVVQSSVPVSAAPTATSAVPPVSTRVRTSSLDAKDTPANASASVVHSALAYTQPSTASAPMPATSASGTFVVQVAAVSHTEDADLLVNALHAKGYAVNARSEAGDKLVHIQVGPFSSKKDADAMRQHLLADGYNAFIK